MTQDNSDLPEDDLARCQENTYVSSVAYYQISEDSLLKKLYHWELLKDFIGRILGKSFFSCMADPLCACSINIFVDWGEHGWDFDESQYTVTLLLQKPEKVDELEYVPRIRGIEGEKHVVANVLDGDRSRVVQLPFMPGTFLIFGGWQTLHRVTPIKGRSSAWFLCYVFHKN